MYFGVVAVSSAEDRTVEVILSKNYGMKASRKNPSTGPYTSFVVLIYLAWGGKVFMLEGEFLVSEIKSAIATFINFWFVLLEM